MSAPWLVDVAWRREVVLEDRSFRWGRAGDDYVAEWAGVLVLRADPAGNVVAVIADPSAPASLVDKVTHGEGAAFARAIAGRFSIHAAAVAFGSAAVALVGSSGAGKSTVAAHLCDRFGAALLADDVAGLSVGASAESTIHVEPSERFVWLAGPDGTKVEREKPRAAEPVQLAALVSLRFAPEGQRASVRRLSGRAAVSALLEALLRFDPGPALWEREFRLVGALVASVPVWQIVRPPATDAERTAEWVAALLHRTPGAR